MSGMLYARVGSSWVPIVGSGGAVPAGGALGDLIIKASAADQDVRWGTDPPKVQVTSATAVTLASTAHPLQIGAATGPNVGFDRSGTIQGRNNGAVAALSINPQGGDVYLGSNGAPLAKVFIGNDAYLQDINVANTLALLGASNPTTLAVLQIGPAARFIGTNTYWQLSSPTSGAGYLDADAQHFRTQAGTEMVTISGGGGNMTVNGMILAVNGGGAAEKLRMVGDGSYLTGYADGSAARRGYLQWNSNDCRLASENGPLMLYAALTVSMRPGNAQIAYFGTGGLTMDGGSYIYWGSYGGGWTMSDGTWMRSFNDKHVYAGAGGFSGNSGFSANYGGFPDGNTGFYGMNKRANMNFNMAAGLQTWGYTQYLAVSNVGGNPGIAAIAFNPANAGVAPIWWCYGAAGEMLSANNNQGSGAIPISASEFRVASTLRIKHDVVPFSDEVVLEQARRVKGIRFRYNIRPMSLRKNAAYYERIANGGDPDIAALAEEQDSFDHDCDLDPCNGTRDDPCCIALNDTHSYGFAAEELIHVLPEVVKVDPERKPYQIDIAQIASLALAAVGALTRRLDELERKLT